MPALDVENLCKRFGGNDVLTNVSLQVSSGEILGIIGPNGAGKSTLFGTISGALPASNGRIRLFGDDITHLSSHIRAQRGLARSFQLTRLFPTLSVLQNTLIALQGKRRSRYQPFRSYQRYPALLDRAGELLSAVDLWSVRDHRAGSLAYGQKKMLEVVLALALSPRVLLLDEPVAGLSIADIPAFVDSIRQVVKDTALVFTEHDLDVVFELADRLLVLNYGEVVASGSPGDVRGDANVREIYLGTHGQ